VSIQLLEKTIVAKEGGGSLVQFEVPVAIRYYLTGGIVFDVSPVISIDEEKDGSVTLYKTDGTFSKLANGWLCYDVSVML